MLSGQKGANGGAVVERMRYDVEEPNPREFNRPTATLVASDGVRSAPLMRESKLRNTQLIHFSEPGLG